MPATVIPSPLATPAFVRDLATFADRPALLGPDGTTTTYAGLATAVDAVADHLGRGGPRRLVLVGGSNTVGSITAYLGALAAGHVVLLAAGDQPEAMAALVDAYDPDVVIARPPDRDGRAPITERRQGSRHDLHPDLALLLSTSGSTGSPKLVRLSIENIEANAAAIVEALGIRPDDRAATSLPMHYTYGLSVVHSHLLVGASLLVTDWSVVDRCFWDRMREERATTLAGVPYTFECLDRIGFDAFDLPDLRSVTQAGGRLDPERVRRYAELGRRRGWAFTVMYGQTEATARMAILPPDLAEVFPTAIGRPIPGGELRVEPVPGASAGIGELVYRGPNVMLGYATTPMDLALGRTVDELRTGDLGRQLPNGIFEVTGRRTAFVKIAGLRIDLEHVERVLAAADLHTVVAGVDDALVVAVEDRGADPDLVRERILDLLPVPARAVQVVYVDELPRLPTGKPDRVAVRDLAHPVSLVSGADKTAAARPTDDPLEAVRALYSDALGRPVDDAATFTSLGGDSLSYVQVSLGLEDVLGRLPPAWPTMSVAGLAALARRRQPRSRWREAIAWRTIEISVVLRALAILAIVAQHSGYWIVLGGAHVLLAVAGYNFARFQLTPAPRIDRFRSQLRAIARIAVPTMLWIAAMLLLTTDYQPQNLVLANAIVGPDVFDATWHFWFVEMLVYVLVGMAILLAIPVVDRMERRWPFALALAVVGVGLVIRFDLIDPDLTNPKPVLWLFAIGWAAGKATSRWQRGLIAAVAVLAVPGFYGDAQREAIITGGLLALIAVQGVRIPALVARIAATLASASLAIYLVHWQIYPRLPDAPRDVVVWACLGAGLLLWAAAGRVSGALRRWWPPRLPVPSERVRPPENLSPAPLHLTSR